MVHHFQQLVYLKTAKIKISASIMRNFLGFNCENIDTVIQYHQLMGLILSTSSTLHPRLRGGKENAVPVYGKEL